MCGAAIAASALSPFWRIRDLSVEGTHHVTVDSAVTTSALVGAPTYLASGARARERLLALPAVRDARVEITVPDRARIVLIERSAVGRWLAGGTEWFVDRDGVIFTSIDPRAAPEVRITDEREARRAGDRLDPALVDAAVKIAGLGPGDLRPDATAPRVVLTAGPNGLVLRVAAGWEIRFGGAERIDEKIANARRFLRDNQQRKLDYVDVRTPDSIVFSPR
ncbi:MAG TPA: FtsQ-type POTRA domain-containing protein [Candidatus Limnocylindria bacterium]|jgi:cell division protein FtsQ|nr:FtsQ-type POTRA domain-containing protein [Candidatus Limnocylindria bacterium]